MRALDLCTGSGCVADHARARAPDVARRRHRPHADALAVARDNALRLGAYNVALRAGDLFAPLRPGRRFDLVTANPPYIATRDRRAPAGRPRFEPRLALDGGADGLALLRRIVAEAPAHLVAGGVLAVEIGADEAPAVRALFDGAGFTAVEIARDYGRLERVVSGVRPS